MLQKFKQSLQRTRKVFTQGIATLFLGKKKIDAELFAELETLLLTADVGHAVTQQIMQQLIEQTARQQLQDADALLQVLRQVMVNCLQPYAVPLPAFTTTKPQVILMLGINGAGKTTTIGKLAFYLQQQKQQVLLAAGDTFRAAAVAQLQSWGEKHAVPVIAQHAGADSAAVIFDAVQAAKARQLDVVLADTAGRLHTQQHLLEELKKIKRVIGRLDATAPHETLLVIDATTGQNALNQAKQFHAAMQLSGLIVTKMDGTAKAGILFAIIQELKLPIYFIGIGEQAEDLQVFDATTFVEALLQVEVDSSDNQTLI